MIAALTSGKRLQNVLEQPLDSPAKSFLLALLGVIPLDHAHAPQRFRQAPRDLRVDLRPLAEDGANRPESPLHGKPKHGEHRNRQSGHADIDFDQHDEGKERRQKRADELHQARPEQVSSPFDVAHDAGDECARFVRVEECDRQPPHVSLDAAAKLGNQPLRRFREELRQGEG